MTTLVVPPAPNVECPKCGAWSGVHCWSMAGGYVRDWHLTGNRSHPGRVREATRARPPAMTTQPELPATHVLGVCRTCEAGAGKPCVSVRSGRVRHLPHHSRRLDYAHPGDDATVPVDYQSGRRVETVPGL